MIVIYVKRENPTRLPNFSKSNSTDYIRPIISNANDSASKIPDYTLQSDPIRIERVIHTTLQDLDINAHKRQTPLETAKQGEANGAIVSIIAVTPDLLIYSTLRTTITSYRTIRPTKTVIENTRSSMPSTVTSATTSASILQTITSFRGQTLPTTMYTISTITTPKQQTNSFQSLTTYLSPTTVETKTSSITTITATQEPAAEDSSKAGHKYGVLTVASVIALLAFVMLCVFMWGQRRTGYPAFIKFSKWLKKKCKQHKQNIPRGMEGSRTPQEDASSQMNLIIKEADSQGLRQMNIPALKRDAGSRRPRRHTRKLKPTLDSATSSSKQGTPKTQRNYLYDNVDSLGGIPLEAVHRDSEDLDTGMASSFVSTQIPRIPTPGFEQEIRNSYVQSTFAAENLSDERRSDSSWLGRNQA
ncbi:hypothetical protein BZA77DRAFT_348919 [Pyronema omphalodes]|nr:hypothetical protein BZA77DRAFT_348919 [Pyronema omphalodes]